MGRMRREAQTASESNDRVEATVGFGQSLITAGTFLVLIALFADPLMVRYPAFAWVQGLGAVIGVAIILAGIYLWSRGKLSR